MEWLLVVIAFFLGLSIGGSWEAGVGVLFMLIYPMVLYFLSLLGLIECGSFITAISFVFWSGALYRVVAEERRSRDVFGKILRELEQIDKKLGGRR